MEYTWENVQEELEIGMAQEAELKDDAEYQKIEIEYTGDSLFDVTLRSDTSSLVHPDFDFDEVIVMCEGYGLTPNDFLREDEDE